MFAYTSIWVEHCFTLAQVSVFGGPAWTYVEERGQWYLHQFLPEQPDLNLTNRAVVSELDDVLTFWLERGVDGFRFDAVAHLVEDGNFDDEPVNKDYTPDGPNEYNSLLHNYTTFHADTYKVVDHWRQMLKKYTEDEGRQRDR